MEYRRSQHAVYMMVYHVVLVVKYRRKVITPSMAEVMKEYAFYLTERFGGSVIEAEADWDHLHILMELPPNIAPSTVVTTLKTQLSKEVRARFKDELEGKLWGDHFWSPSYFIATAGGVTIDTLKAYVESQPTEEHHRKYVKSGKYSKKKRPQG